MADDPIMFYRVDIDDVGAVMAHEKIVSLPLLRIFKAGKKVAEVIKIDPIPLFHLLNEFIPSPEEIKRKALEAHNDAEPEEEDMYGYY